MKATLATVIFMGLMTVNAASAAEHTYDTDGKEKIGVVSASNAYTLNELSNDLSRKAAEQGATSYKILSATGKNRLHGVAEIYK